MSAFLRKRRHANGANRGARGSGKGHGRWSGVAEYQVHGAWDDLLTEFAALGAVEGRLGHAEATAALRALADNALFQPEQPEAPIQILGILEATGLPFDGLWVAGLAAERWPSPPRPNPFLPLPWQRGRNVPRSNASRELEYAKALAPQWLRAARRVVFSHAVNALKRIAYSHFLRNFSAASVELTAGCASLLFGLVFGLIRWCDSISTATPVTAGTVMLAALPVILGSQFLLSFLNYDVRSIPQIPLHKRLGIEAPSFSRAFECGIAAFPIPVFSGGPAQSHERTAPKQARPAGEEAIAPLQES